MKFGNYNMNPPASGNNEKSATKLDLFGFNRLKLSAPNFIGRFHSRIETFRRLKSRCESPLSYQASLFEADVTRGSSATTTNTSTTTQRQKCYGKFTTNDFPQNIRLTNNTTANNKFSSDNFYVFGKKVRKIGAAAHHVNITGRNYHVAPSSSIMLQNHRISTDKLPPTPPSHSIKRVSKVRRQNSTLKDILDSATHLDEDMEFRVLKDYFETNSYTDIVNDPDFKNYLNKKNYSDILDYMEADSIGGVGRRSVRLSNLSCSDNDDDDDKDGTDGSKYKRKLLAEHRHRLLSKSTGNLYESLTSYNQPDEWRLQNPPKYRAPIRPPADQRRNAFCNSIKRLKSVRKPAENRLPELAKCKSNCPHAAKYNEIKKFCQLFFDENRAFDSKVKMSTLGKQFTERAYRKVIEKFVRSKGFDRTEQYVYAKFGSILDQSVSFDLTAADDIHQRIEYSKKYTENIPKRYHVTKQKFLEADLSKYVGGGGGGGSNYYTLPEQFRRKQQQQKHCNRPMNNATTTTSTMPRHNRSTISAECVGGDPRRYKRNLIKDNYSSSFKSKSTNGGSTHTNSSTTTSALNNMTYGDYCFKKRYNNKMYTRKCSPTSSGGGGGGGGASDNCGTTTTAAEGKRERLQSYHRRNEYLKRPLNQHKHHQHQNNNDCDYGLNWSSSKNYDFNMNYVKKKKRTGRCFIIILSFKLRATHLQKIIMYEESSLLLTALLCACICWFALKYSTDIAHICAKVIGFMLNDYYKRLWSICACQCECVWIKKKSAHLYLIII